MSQNQSAEQEVLAAAHLRASALADGDEAALRQLMHPDMSWTTYRGEVLAYDEYIAGNVGGGLTWQDQTLEGVRVAVVGDTAVLTALVTDHIRRDGRDQAFTLRLTQTWVCSSGSWRCLAGHASAPVA